MNIIAIIPARGGSKGIPNKNIVDFCGKPLLAWSIEQALDSKHIDNIFVSSDNDEILEIARQHGALAIPRPDKYSGDEATSESALLHAFNLINSIVKVRCDLIVFLQATSPLRTTQDIDNAIEKAIVGNYDSVFSACPAGDLLMWKEIANGKLLTVNHNYKTRERRQDMDEHIIENGSIYVFTPRVLLDHNNRLGGSIGFSMMDKYKMHEIDDMESLELCEYYMNKKILKNGK